MHWKKMTWNEKDKENSWETNRKEQKKIFKNENTSLFGPDSLSGPHSVVGLSI